MPLCDPRPSRPAPSPSSLLLPSSPLSGVHKSLSFDDFSLGTIQDAEDTLSPKKGDDNSAAADEAAPATPAAVASAAPPHHPHREGARATWASVFNPGRNNNPAATSPGADQYDHTHAPADDPRSVWDEVIKAERMKSFASLDKDNDGFISAADLRAALGPGADVDQMVRAADTSGDGKVDYADFSELLRNS